MKKIHNMKLWQKIVIVFLLVIVFNTIIVKPVHADVSADILVKPITGLFVGIADSIESTMQKIAIGVDESLVHIETNKIATFWANFLVIGAFIVGTAIAIIAAVPTGGASVGAWVAFSITALGTIAIAGGSFILLGSHITTIVEKMLSDEFDFPQFALSPYEIFDNKITILDINFFNPKENEKKAKESVGWIKSEISLELVVSSQRDEGTFKFMPDRTVVNKDKFHEKYSLFDEELCNLKRDDISFAVETARQALDSVDADLYMDQINRAIAEYQCESFEWDSANGTKYVAVMIDGDENDMNGDLGDIDGCYVIFGPLFRYGKYYSYDIGDNITKPLFSVDDTIVKTYTTTMNVLNSITSVTVDKREFENLYGSPFENFTKSDFLGIEKTIWNYNGKQFGVFGEISEDDNTLTFEYIPFELTFIDGSKSPARELRTYVAGWYVTLRNLALVALLSILVYIGIRIVLSSVASDKAKYKQMLIDWIVAICLLFIMHYIMSFSVFIVEKITEMVDSIQVDVTSKEEAIQKAQAAGKGSDSDVKVGYASDIIKLDGTNDNDMKNKVRAAYETMKNTEYKSFFFKDANLNERAENKDEANVLVWPTGNFMEKARMYYQIHRKNGDDNYAMLGYGLIYVVLVIYTVIFLFTYTKRIVYMAFLTVIAPLVAVTYPIDKLNDGKAQAFDMWFKEYLFNLLLQPLHLLLYSVLIGAAMYFASENLIYVIMALGFFMPAEKLLRRFFGFEKAQTPGMFGGPAGSALMFSGLQRLMHPKPPHGGLGPGNGKDDKDGGEQDKAPRTQKIDESEGFLGEGNNNENNSDGFAFSDDTYTPSSGNFQLLDNDNQPDDNSEESTFRLDGFGANPNEIKANEYKDGEWSEANNDDTYTFAMNPSSDNTETTNPIQRNNQRTNETTGRENLTRGQRIRNGLSRGIRGYRRGLHNRYVARKAQKGGMLRRGVRLAGGVAAATAFTTAAGLAAIVSGEPSKQIGNIVTAGVGGYKVGSNLGERASGTVKNQKEMVQDALKEGKKGYKGSDYSKKQQEKYIKQFKKNEEYLNALQDRLSVDRKQAQEIMETHAEDYVNNGITDMDEFAAVYKLEQDFGNRDKAIATRHYAMERLDGKKVKNIDPEKKAKYDNMFMQEFMKRGKSQQEAANTVNELYDAVNRFHSYKK